MKPSKSTRLAYDPAAQTVVPSLPAQNILEIIRLLKRLDGWDLISRHDLGIGLPCCSKLAQSKMMCSRKAWVFALDCGIVSELG